MGFTFATKNLHSTFVWLSQVHGMQTMHAALSCNPSCKTTDCIGSIIIIVVATCACQASGI